MTPRQVEKHIRNWIDTVLPPFIDHGARNATFVDVRREQIIPGFLAALGVHPDATRFIPAVKAPEPVAVCVERIFRELGVSVTPECIEAIASRATAEALALLENRNGSKPN